MPCSMVANERGDNNLVSIYRMVEALVEAFEGMREELQQIQAKLAELTFNDNKR